MVTIRTGAADIVLGRQPIAWGSARVVNPTDILAPFAFNELDKEDRTGVDAVRVRVPFGAMDELDAGFVSGDKLRAANNAFYVRGKINRLKPTSPASPWPSARTCFSAWTWPVRSAVRAPGWKRPTSSRALRAGGRLEGDGDYFRASAGMDYNFGPKTYGFVEYHFNSAGGARPADYASLAGTVAYRDGATYLLGRHYLSVGSTYRVTALTPFTGLLIINLTDPSAVLSPSLAYNVAENVDLAAGAYVRVGRCPVLLPTMSPLPTRALRSEFGTYPDVVYVSFRVYF